MRRGRVTPEGSTTEALREMRAMRRRRYVEDLDLMEVLYRVYIGAIFGAIGLGVLGGAIHEAPATPAAIEWLRLHGPALLGLGVALLLFAGLRAGARGGPLAIEAAEVQYVLLAPLDRGAVLRPGAWRQLRVAAIVGAVLGGILGNFVFRRLSGSPVEWIGCLALFGALVPVSVLGCALLASGRRLRPLAATGIGALLVAWSAVDLACGWTSSPGSLLGQLATLPLQGGTGIALAGLGAALVAALVGFGLAGIGGVLLDAARRRAALTAELRFSAAVQDVRAVVLLRRQLASERPRRRPWLALGTGPTRYPIWRRDWQSFLRWPPARIARALLVGAAAGALTAGAWSGATFAFFLPGLLLFVIGLDFIEPLAQESDHPTRRQLLPVAPSLLIRRHLAAPATAIAAVVLVGALGAVAVGAPVSTAFGVGAVVAAPIALALACCAAFSATSDPYAYVLTPQLGYAIMAAPLLGSSILVGVPMLAAWAAERGGGSPVGAAAGSVIVIVLVALPLTAGLGVQFSKRDKMAAE